MRPFLNRDQLCHGDFVLQVAREPVSYRFLVIVSEACSPFRVALIPREFLVGLDELSRVVANFLPETQRLFTGRHFLNPKTGVG